MGLNSGLKGLTNIHQHAFAAWTNTQTALWP